MSLQRIKETLKQAPRVDGIYQINLEPHDFNALADLIDFHTNKKLKRVTFSQMLKILPEAK